MNLQMHKHTKNSIMNFYQKLTLGNNGNTREKHKLASNIVSHLRIITAMGMRFEKQVN